MLADDPDSHWARSVVGPPPVADIETTPRSGDLAMA